MKTKIKGLPKGQREMLEVILGKECPKYVEDITPEQEKKLKAFVRFAVEVTLCQ
jgi:hypothetical protein